MKEEKERWEEILKEKECERIFQRWKKAGIDTDFVKGQLLIAYNISCSNKDKVKKETIAFHKKEKKLIQKIINCLEELETYSIVFDEKSKSEKLANYRVKLNTLNILTPLDTKGRPLKYFSEEISSTIEVPLFRIYKHLTKHVGIKSYGREEAIPKKYLRDILTLFKKISPEFKKVNWKNISKKISYTKQSI